MSEQPGARPAASIDCPIMVARRRPWAMSWAAVVVVVVMSGLRRWRAGPGTGRGAGTPAGLTAAGAGRAAVRPAADPRRWPAAGRRGRRRAGRAGRAGGPPRTPGRVVAPQAIAEPRPGW